MKQICRRRFGLWTFEFVTKFWKFSDPEFWFFSDPKISAYRLWTSFTILNNSFQLMDFEWLMRTQFGTNCARKRVSRFHMVVDWCLSIFTPFASYSQLSDVNARIEFTNPKLSAGIRTLAFFLIPIMYFSIFSWSKPWYEFINWKLDTAY